MKWLIPFYLWAAPWALAQETRPSGDPVMNIIEKATEEHQQKSPPQEEKNLFGLTAGFGLPQPFSWGGVFIHSSRSWSAEISTGATSGSYQGADVKIENFQIAGHWHPWQNPFYFGFAWGQQSLRLQDSDIVSNQRVEAEVKIKSHYSRPHIGWLWGIKNSGFFWGMKLGWHIPSNPKTTFTTRPDLSGNSAYDAFATETRDQAEEIGKSSLPYLGLFHFGWIF